MGEQRTVVPDPEFYEKFNTSQILDIVASLDVRREVPYEYSYIGSGAAHWDRLAQNLLAAGPGNYLTDVIELIRASRDDLDRLVGLQKLVNIVDLGVGNCLPVRPLIEHYALRGQLDRYIGLDISPEMLRIADRNIKVWFGGRVRFEGYVRDLNLHLFNGLILAPHRTNVVVYFGSTIANFRRPEPSLQVIHQSMGPDDVLLFTLKLDSEKSRQYFDFIGRPGPSDLFQGKNLVELLNIERDSYEVEQFFDTSERTRRTRIRMKVPVTVRFDLEGHPKAVEIDAGDTVLLWRARHLDRTETVDLLHDNGFSIVQATLSPNQEHLLAMCRKVPVQPVDRGGLRPGDRVGARLGPRLS